MDEQRTHEEIVKQLIATSQKLGRQSRLRRDDYKALHESRETVSKIFESSPDAITVSDLNGVILDCNPAAVEMHGYSIKEEIVGLSGFMLIAPKDRPVAVEQLKKMLVAGSTKEVEITCLRKDGSEFIVEFSASIMKDTDGEPVSFVIVSKDITQRRKFVEALRKSEEEMRLLIEDTKDTIFWADSDTGIVIHCNKSAERLLEKNKEEIIGRHFSDMYQPENRKNASERFMKYMLFYTGKEALPDVETEVVTKSGKIIPVHISTSMIKINGRPVVQGIFRDISLMKEAQREKEELIVQLSRSQKMQAVGLLAGGMAHDFKNILTVINGYAHLALMGMNPDDANREYANKILKSVERAQRLTLRLLSFTRNEKISVEDTSVKWIIKELEDMVRGSLTKNIEIESNVRESSSCVTADTNLLLQALLNICFNAADAMPDGGKLQITGSQAALDEEFSKSHPDIKPGHFYLIQISDTGHGIPEDIKDRIFEPLFTTKNRGEGTGLGLSVSLGIIKSQNGAIDIASKAGEGTTVNLYMPISGNDC